MKHLCLIIILFLSISVYSADYKITKVVEVGPASYTPFSGPINWSPDGTMISYFNRGYLMVSDTLGNTREIEKFERMPYRYEWISNDEIAILFREMISHDSIYMPMIKININDKNVEEIDSYFKTKEGKYKGKSAINGPFLSIEGNPYYVEKELTDSTVRTKVGRYRNSINNYKLLN